MYYLNAVRLEVANATKFFKNFVKSRLPEDVAMSNHGRDTALRFELNDELVELVNSNIQLSIVRSF